MMGSSLRDHPLDQLVRPRLSELDLGDCQVRITSPERVLWPAHDGRPPVTRRDLLRYFVELATKPTSRLNSARFSRLDGRPGPALL
jgi:hypothetical protein